ncbi:MAG: ATP-binding cassette domain-containing protein [Pseudomonadota bacterium]
MATAPLLSLTDVMLTHGGRPLFSAVDCQIQPGERACLVGRNGAGKSTLLRLMQGAVEPDGGSRSLRADASVAYLEQDPELSAFATLGDVAAADLAAGEEHRALRILDGLGLDPGIATETASGGERRRAALARLLAAEADLLLLDEPTNHLDITAITWLEAHLTRTKAAVLVISHDRAFLRALTKVTYWIDRGVLRRLPEGFAAFEDWRDRVYQEEATAAHKRDRQIAAEGRWAVEGISARRKRNQGRLRRLQQLRAERAEALRQPGVAQLALDTAPRSGQRVIEAEAVSKRFGDREIVADFSLRIARGERVAFVGPNGVGKTTLLNLLIGRELPDSGHVRHGTNLELAVFDQARAALDPEATLHQALVEDPTLRSGQGNDQILVRGTPRHVVGYLKDFLFDERQVRGPVRALSGGERARLLLARLMAKPANVLVLDEPTNDFDVETLDLLQGVLDSYDGTALIVSHDRDFLDRVATTTVAMEGDGRATVYAGGWSDYQAQRGPVAEVAPPKRTPRRPAQRPERPQPKVKRLSSPDVARLAALPEEIERLGGDIRKVEALLADPDLYRRDPERFEKATKILTARQDALHAAEEEWMALELRREAAEAASGSA